MRRVPDDPLEFIKSCVRRRQVIWGYHVNMRFKGRFISRDAVIGAVDSFEIIEDYEEQRYDPTYLVFGVVGERPFHLPFVVDVEDDVVRALTAYWPGADEWEPDMRTRRSLT